MSQSTHQVAIKGVDKTATAFQSIQARAIATGRRLSSVMGGALAAAGSYLSFRAIKSGIDELGRLSDEAQAANTTVDRLTKTVSSLNILGISTSTGQLAKSLQIMTMRTGKIGMEGFYETIDALGKIEDPAKRAQAAMQAFGKSGLSFMPIINGAKDGVRALREVEKAFPGVSQAAADAGDDIADGASIVSNQFKTWWLEAVGKVAGWISGAMPKSFRQSMAVIMAYADYYLRSTIDIIRSMWLRVTTFGGYLTSFSNAAGATVGATFTKLFGPGGTIPRALVYCEEFFVKTWHRITRGFGALTAAANATGAAIGGTFEKVFGSGGSWSDVGKSISQAWRAGFDDYDGEMDDISKKYEMRLKQLGEGLSWSEVGKQITDAWSRGRQEYEDELEEIEDRMQARADSFGERFYAAENLEFNYKQAAKSLPEQSAGETFGAAAAKRIQNALTLAGSNQERRIALLGPEYQNEAKKQTEFLKQIAKNTDRTATNTEGGDDYPSTDL